MNLSKSLSLRGILLVPHARVVVLGIAGFLLSFTGAALAGSHVVAESPAATKSLDEETIARYEQALSDIASNMRNLASLEARFKSAQGLRKELLDTRIDRSQAATLESVTGLALDMAGKQKAGYDISAYKSIIVDYLQGLPSAIEAAMEPIDQGRGFPDPSLSAIEMAAIDEQTFAGAARFDDGSWALKRGIDAARGLGVDTTSEEAYLAKRVTEFVADVSVYLDLALAQATNLSAAASVLPDDAELQAKLLLADRRIQRTAGVIENNLPLFDFLGLETQIYSQQLVAATGQVSTDIFDADLLGTLVSDWAGNLIETIRLEGPNLVFQLLLLLVILFFFLKLAKIVERLVSRTLESSGVQLSALLKRMVTAVSYNGIVIIGVLMALSQLGISLGPLLAGLGIVGFIIGFALQDSLANFASGMLILVYRPYDVGDLVEVGGAFGTVESMSLVNTTVLTLDNQTLIVPNNRIWQDVIKNLTYQQIRRVDMEFGIAYDQDIDQADKVLHEVVEADERVLQDPELNIRVHTLGDSSVNFIVRPWVKTDDYWDVYWDITKRVKQRFDAEGISIPFPQRDVHLFAGDADAKNMLGIPSTTASPDSNTHIVDNDASAGEADG